MPRKQSLSQSMNGIGRLIHSTLDFDEIMQRVISEAAQAVGSETAAISLRQGGYWVVRYVHGFPKDVIGARMSGRMRIRSAKGRGAVFLIAVNAGQDEEKVRRSQAQSHLLMFLPSQLLPFLGARACASCSSMTTRSCATGWRP